MKQLISSAFALILFIGTTGLAEAQTRNSDAKDFNAIKVSGPFDVAITMGNTESVKITGSDEDINQMEVSVKDGTLIIKQKISLSDWKVKTIKKKVSVQVSAKTLNGISLSGSGDVKVSNQVKADDLRLNLSGSGGLEATVQAKNLTSNLSGSGSIRVKGTAEKTALIMSGSGQYSAGELKAASCKVIISGSGNATVNASESLSGKVSGSGNLNYHGKPELSTSVTGSGRVRANG